MRWLGLHRVIGPDQRDHLAERGIGGEQGALLAWQQFEPEQFCFSRELHRNVDCHGRYSAALSIGAALCCRSSAIISSVERISANITMRFASVALCSSSVRHAFAS